MKLLHVKLRAFADSAPQNRTAFLMDFEHVTFRLFPRVTKNSLKNHRHVRHQIHRIVVNDDLPRDIELFLFARVCLPDWRFHCRGRSFFELHGADRAHEKNLITLCSYLKERPSPEFALATLPLRVRRLDRGRQSRANEADRERCTSEARARVSFRIVERFVLPFPR